MSKDAQAQEHVIRELLDSESVIKSWNDEVDVRLLFLPLNVLTARRRPLRHGDFDEGDLGSRARERE